MVLLVWRTDKVVDWQERLPKAPAACLVPIGGFFPLRLALKRPEVGRHLTVYTNDLDTMTTCSLGPLQFGAVGYIAC